MPEATGRHRESGVDAPCWKPPSPAAEVVELIDDLLLGLTCLSSEGVEDVDSEIGVDCKIGR